MNVTALGRIASEPEVNFTDKGVCYTSFSFVENEYYKGKQTSTFIRSVCFGKLAEWAGEHLEKGDQIVIEQAKLNISKYEKEGENRMSVSLVINKLQKTSSKKRDNNEYKTYEKTVQSTSANNPGAKKVS